MTMSGQTFSPSDQTDLGIGRKAPSFWDSSSLGGLGIQAQDQFFGYVFVLYGSGYSLKPKYGPGFVFSLLFTLP